jgi:hypothetical protein
LERYEKVKPSRYVEVDDPVPVESLVACGAICVKLDTCQGFHVANLAAVDHRIACQHLSLIEDGGNLTDMSAWKLNRILRKAVLAITGQQ